MELKILTLDTVVNSGIHTPELIQYDNLGFFKKKTTSKGLLDRCEYYLNFDGVAYSNLIVDVLYSYTFNGVIYTGSTTTVKWIAVDESVGYEKVFTKTFMPWEIIDFGMTKRNNIISTTKLYTLNALGYTNGVDLLNTVDPYVSAYIQGAPPTVLTDQINALVGVKPYLTQPIADNINAILSDI